MRRPAEKGIALIIVISILAIVSIMAISFTFTMRLEAKSAANYQISTQAGYLAEAGLARRFPPAPRGIVPSSANGARSRSRSRELRPAQV